MSIFGPDVIAGARSPSFMKGGVACGIGGTVVVSSIQGVAGLFLGKISLWLIPFIPLSLLGGLLVVIWGNRTLHNAARRLTKVRDSVEDLGDGPLYLYLRPFVQDLGLDREQPQPLIWNALRSIFTVPKSEEQHIVEAIGTRQGRQTLAAVRPGERQPQIGATRIRLSSNSWQSQVASLMLRSDRVALVVGPSSGTLWELAEGMRILQPNRLLLVVAMSGREYSNFRHVAEQFVAEHLERSGVERSSRPASLLPDYVSSSVDTLVQGVISFSRNWDPEYRPLRRYSRFYSSLRGMILRATPSLDGRFRREYEYRPPLVLVSAGLLAFVAAIASFLIAFQSNSAESFFLGLNGVAITVLTPIIVGTCLLRGTPNSDVAAYLYFIVLIGVALLVDRNLIGNGSSAEAIIHFTRDLVVPALGLPLLISGSARRYYRG